MNAVRRRLAARAARRDVARRGRPGRPDDAARLLLLRILPAMLLIVAGGTAAVVYALRAWLDA